MAITLVADPYGGTDAIQVSSFRALSPKLPDSMTKFTIQVWFKPDGSNTVHERWAFYTQIQDTVTLGYQPVGISWYGPTNAFLYYLGGVLYSASGGLTADLWYHLALVFEGAEVKVYKNGVLFNTGSSGILPNPAVTIPDAFVDIRRVGAVAIANDAWFDLCILDRALTAEEIAWYYADRLTNGANSLPPGD